MIPFFERTWFLWWIFAAIAIVRRSQMFSADFALPELDSSPYADDNQAPKSNSSLKP